MEQWNKAYVEKHQKRMVFTSPMFVGYFVFHMTPLFFWAAMTRSISYLSGQASWPINVESASPTLEGIPRENNKR